VPTERRQSTPIYRNVVADLAHGYVLAADHDYDAAYESCREDAETAKDCAVRVACLWADAAALLRRRADTVRGLRNA
jgi:hypothetical protein